MSNKIVSPFTGPITANGLKVWLGQAEDAFENYQDTHKGAELSVKTRIRLTGSSLQEPSMADWWSMGRKEYLELSSWEAFVKKLKDRFLPVDWKTDALEAFYRCSQGKRDFRMFAAELAQLHGTLPTGCISTTVFKYHILFFAHDQLLLRMRALQNFSIDATDMSPDQLISLMSAQWDSLVADTASRSGRSLAVHTQATPPVSTRTSAAPQPTTVLSAGPPRLSEEEKAALSAQNACWNCRRKPGDADWTPHNRHTCPGNPSIGAPPGRHYVAPSTVAAATSGLAAFAMASENDFYPDADTSDEEDDGIPWGGSDDDDFC